LPAVAEKWFYMPRCKEGKVRMAVQRDKKKGCVTFVFNKKNISSVSVAGDFNNWNPAAGRMAKARDGSFRASFVIIPGRHEYKFVADGIWVVDEGSERKVQNIFGSFNSIVEV
jgi:1,4-alpha-glucan branching enzyme